MSMKRLCKKVCFQYTVNLCCFLPGSIHAYTLHFILLFISILHIALLPGTWRLYLSVKWKTTCLSPKNIFCCIQATVNLNKLLTVYFIFMVVGFIGVVVCVKRTQQGFWRTVMCRFNWTVHFDTIFLKIRIVLQKPFIITKVIEMGSTVLVNNQLT